MPLHILLASGSPRRRALLRELGLSFEALSPDVPEERIPGEDPAALCERLARLKAGAVKNLNDSGLNDNFLVIAADTIVVIDGRVLGKPADRREACGMLGLLQGRTHDVMTGIALSWNGRILSGVERTAVRFRTMSVREIQAYAATGEGDDKAGAYAIQGKGALLVESIEGDYFNVVGLPVCRLGKMLESVGLSLENLLNHKN